MEESWTLFSAILGVGKLPYISRIHTAYIGEHSSILGTNEMFGEYRDGHQPPSEIE